MRWKQWVREAGAVLSANWGFALFSLLSLLACVRLLREPLAQHYYLFIEAANYLWRGESPYGVSISPIGYWFYSPSCGMFFFSLFAWLPAKLGQMVFVATSWGLLVASLWKLLDRYRVRARSVFWVLISPQILGAIWATKIEMVLVAALAFAVWLLSSESKARPVLAAFLLATVSAWKFQLLPSVGLIYAFLLLRRADWKSPLWFAGFAGLWTLAPLVRFTPGELRALWEAQGATLEPFARASVFNFDSVFAFFHHTLGWAPSWDGVRMVTLAAAAALLIHVVIWERATRGRPNDSGSAACGILMAAAFGSAFTVLFNPVSQNNALIQLAPVYLLFLVHLESLPSGSASRRAGVAVLVSVWLVLTFAYSDGIGPYLRPYAVKPGAILLMLAYLYFRMLPAGLRSLKGTPALDSGR